VDQAQAKPGAALDRSLIENHDQIERAEVEIDAFISRRAAREVQERAEAEAWQESSRKHAAQRRTELCDEWAAYHVAAAERLRSTVYDMIQRHEQQAAFYEAKKGA
jgi:hypothetical protein